MLCPERTDEGSERVAPLRRVLAKALEVLLERQADLRGIAAECDHLGCRLYDRVEGAVERAPLRKGRVEAERHGRGRRRLCAEHRQLGDHALSRRQLRLAAERHEHRVAADCRVEALGKTFLAADIEVLEIREPCLLEVLTAGLDGCRDFCKVALCRIRLGDDGRDMLAHAVRVEERAVHLDDLVAAPLHDQARLLRDDGYRRRLEVLLIRELLEGLDILRVEHDSHALLRFGDGKLRAVEALVLLLDRIEVDDEAVGELTDGDGDTAGTEVVAALDHEGDLRVAEQALDLALRRRVALLDLCAAGRQRLFRVLLRRARRTAAAVAARAAADEHDDVTGCRALAHDVLLRCSRDDGTDLHALRHVALVVDLADLARRKADLVAVRAVASGSAERDLLLRQLARQRLAERTARISSARHAHGLVDIRAARERVADGTAKAGRRAAERLDLRRMVVCLVLEHDEPVFLLAADVRLDDDAAGVDLL